MLNFYKLIMRPIHKFANHALSLTLSRIASFAIASFVGLAVVLTAMAPEVARAQFSSAPGCPVEPTQPTEEGWKQLQAAAQDRGFLWKIEKDGRTSYIYGTMHLLKPEWFFPGPIMGDALRSVDAIALEVDPLDPEMQAEFARLAQADQSRLPPDLLARMTEVAAKLCLDKAVFTQMPAKLQMVFVSLAIARFEGLFADYGREIMLAGVAQASNRPVISLESAALQDEVLSKVLVSPEAFAHLRTKSTDKDFRDAQMLLKRLTTAWSNRDLKSLESYAQWCKCLETAWEKRSNAMINDDRNLGIADRIAQIHAEKSVFAAVGALHFTGEKAVQKLMEKKGFKVTYLY